MIDVVGIGDDGWVGLNQGRRAVIERATILLGGRRQLGLLAGHVAPGAQLVPWPRPLRPALPGLIDWAHAAGDVVVIASGDPLRSGIGTTLIDLLGPQLVRIHPAIGSDVLARARQGWSAEETIVVTTVGRDLRCVLPHLYPGARLVVLCSDGTDPAQLAALLTKHGWAATTITARWHLGGSDEGALSARADVLTEATPDLVLCCLEVRPTDPSVVTTAGPVPGRPEEFIDHDGQVTKRDLRAAALARLRPTPDAHLWDLGAGNGSIALEWCLAAERTSATCLERDVTRAQAIRDNADSLGVGARIEVVHGDTESTDLTTLPTPDAVFVGGGLEADVLERAWAALPLGGRLVAHAVTLSGEATLIGLRERAGGDLARVSVEHALPLGRFLSWTPARAVVQFFAIRTSSTSGEA